MIANARSALCAVLALAGLACAGAGHPPAEERPAMESIHTGDISKVDHVLLGIGDLQKGIDELESRTGVRAAFGGVHPGRGTQNALISLGEHHYLEILAPNPKEKGGEGVDQLRGLTVLTPFGWAARANDLPWKAGNPASTSRSPVPRATWISEATSPGTAGVPAGLPASFFTLRWPSSPPWPS